MKTFKRFILGFMSACVLLCGMAMFAGKAEAATFKVPPIPKLGTQHNTYPHQKRLRLKPIFHHQKMIYKGKWVPFKMAKKWSYKANKYVMVKVPVIHQTKLKLGNVPKVKAFNVHHAKVYKVPKVKGVRVPTWKGKGWTEHSVVYHYKK